jgi:hypothetical protein
MRRAMISAIAVALLGAGLEYQVKAAFLFNFLKFIEWPSSAPGFRKSGGAINFVLEDQHAHFKIQPSPARAADLHLSSQLLKLGRAL